MYVGIEITASNINAFNCHMVYGYPSPFTFWGFAHNIALKLNGKLENERFLFINHFYEARVSGDNFNIAFNRFRSSSREASSRPAQTDDPRANINFSIIFEIYNEDELHIDDIQELLKSLRFAGGIIDTRKTKVYLENDEISIIKKIRKGYICKEVNLNLTNSDNHFLSIFDKLKIEKGKSNGWNMPTLLAYGLIEEPRERDNVRFNYLHAFAEPLVGVVQFKGFKKYGENISSLDKDGWSLVQDNKTIKFTNKGL